MSWKLSPLPFFDERHQRLAERLMEWRSANADLAEVHPEGDFGPACRDILQRLKEWGFLDLVLPRVGPEGVVLPDVRSICVVREALAYDSFLADSVFVMQGLGTAPLWRHPDAGLRDAWLEPCRRGEHIAALALTEPGAGSDLASVETTATLADAGESYVLNGVKAWISNAGIADHYIVVARTGEAPRSRGLSAFIVAAGTPGLIVGPNIDLIAPHPIGEVRFENCRVPRRQMVGAAGEGFKAAMATFDIFRPSVGAAAVGAARRALAETVARVKKRRMFGKTMAEMETVQHRIADMTADTEAASLMVYRAAWALDVLGGRVSRESALAKLAATEAAQRVIDSAVQLFGALGVARGTVVERLYRDIRPMRIYEGASEVQKIVIARSVLADAPSETPTSTATAPPG